MYHGYIAKDPRDMCAWQRKRMVTKIKQGKIEFDIVLTEKHPFRNFLTHLRHHPKHVAQELYSTKVEAKFERNFTFSQTHVIIVLSCPFV